MEAEIKRLEGILRESREKEGNIQHRMMLNDARIRIIERQLVGNNARQREEARAARVAEESRNSNSSSIGHNIWRALGTCKIRMVT